MTPIDEKRSYLRNDQAGNGTHWITAVPNDIDSMLQYMDKRIRSCRRMEKFFRSAVEADAIKDHVAYGRAIDAADTEAREAEALARYIAAVEALRAFKCDKVTYEAVLIAPETDDANRH